MAIGGAKAGGSLESTHGTTSKVRVVLAPRDLRSADGRYEVCRLIPSRRPGGPKAFRLVLPPTAQVKAASRWAERWTPSRRRIGPRVRRRRAAGCSVVYEGLIDPRLVKVRAGRRGSGWAIGTRGVLTARHVLKRFLAGEEESCVVTADPAPGAPVFDCEVTWDDADRDLAVLRICQDDQVAAWSAAVSRGGPVVLAEPGSRAVNGDAVGYPDAVLDQRVPQPELAPGKLLPAQGVLSGRMPFDVDASVPADWRLWEGMSGAALRDGSGRVLGVVIEVDPDRAQRRLYVAILPDPNLDTGFADALIAVGAPPAVQADDAPANRELLVLLDPGGRPYTVAAVPDLAGFGTRRSRTDVDTHGDPYYPYIHRDVDQVLRDALDRGWPRPTGGC